MQLKIGELLRHCTSRATQEPRDVVDDVKSYFRRHYFRDKENAEKEFVIEL